MKILVTGHKGYLGSEFLRLHGKNYEIIGYDREDGEELLDFEALNQKIKGCEQVVHLAAIPKPVEGKSFEDYFSNNVQTTFNVAKAATANNLKRIIYASSTTIYGVEKGIPFKTPIKENQQFVSQYIAADQLKTRDVDLAYHVSKVMAEQIMAWYGLNKKIETIALRFGPINKVFLGTSISMENACQAIKLALDADREFWYEPFSIVDSEVKHIDISKAQRLLGFKPLKADYSEDQIHSRLDDVMS